MAILRERNDLDKKWTWYLFLLANVCVLIGCAATWMMVAKGQANLLYLPTVICNLIAIVLAAVFMWLESKDTMPKAVHFQKKWLWFYLTALIIFCSSIIFNTVWFVLVLNEGKAFGHANQWKLIVYFVITGVLTLVAIGFQRYARFRIDLDIYRRKHGQNPKAKDDAKAEAKAKAKQEKIKKSDAKATSGLLDEIDKK